MDKTHVIGHFSQGFYYTSNFFRILRILLHFKHLSYKTTQHKRSENSPFSRNLVVVESKRRGQGGVMRTEHHKISDANHIVWINLIQRKTKNCAKMGFMAAQRSYTYTCFAQVTATGLFVGFSFRGLKKLTSLREDHSQRFCFLQSASILWSIEL